MSSGYDIVWQRKLIAQQTFSLFITLDLWSKSRLESPAEQGITGCRAVTKFYNKVNSHWKAASNHKHWHLHHFYPMNNPVGWQTERRQFFHTQSEFASNSRCNAWGGSFLGGNWFQIWNQPCGGIRFND